MMKRHLVIVLLLLSARPLALGTSFTYQGRLADAGAPANGIYDLELKAYDAETAGNQVGPTLLRDDIVVNAGVLTLSLDFGGSAFNGADRWLEIGVRPGNSSDAYTPLTPRQALTAAPYALHAADVGCLSCVSGAELDFDPATQVELNVHATSSDHDARYVRKVGDAMTGVLTLPANGLAAGSSQLVLSNGNVGVGTAAPSSRLDVRGGSAFVEGSVTVGSDYNYSPVKTRYLNVYPSEFRPAATFVTLGVDNSYGADVRIATGCCPGVLAAPVYLPNGVTVTNLSCGILDNVADTPQVSLMRKGLTGTGPNLALSAVSPGNSAAIQTVSASGSVQVDTNASAYALAFIIGAIDSSCAGACKLYGCKLTYTAAAVD